MSSFGSFNLGSFGSSSGLSSFSLDQSKDLSKKSLALPKIQANEPNSPQSNAKQLSSSNKMLDEICNAEYEEALKKYEDASKCKEMIQQIKQLDKMISGITISPISTEKKTSTDTITNLQSQISSIHQQTQNNINTTNNLAAILARDNLNLKKITNLMDNPAGYRQYVESLKITLNNQIENLRLQLLQNFSQFENISDHLVAQLQTQQYPTEEIYIETLSDQRNIIRKNHRSLRNLAKKMKRLQLLKESLYEKSPRARASFGNKTSTFEKQREDQKRKHDALVYRISAGKKLQVACTPKKSTSSVHSTQAVAAVIPKTQDTVTSSNSIPRRIGGFSRTCKTKTPVAPLIGKTETPKRETPESPSSSTYSSLVTPLHASTNTTSSLKFSKPKDVKSIQFPAASESKSLKVSDSQLTGLLGKGKKRTSTSLGFSDRSGEGQGEGEGEDEDDGGKGDKVDNTPKSKDTPISFSSTPAKDSSSTLFSTPSPSLTDSTKPTSLFLGSSKDSASTSISSTTTKDSSSNLFSTPTKDQSSSLFSTPPQTPSSTEANKASTTLRFTPTTKPSPSSPFSTPEKSSTTPNNFSLTTTTKETPSSPFSISTGNSSSPFGQSTPLASTTKSIFGETKSPLQTQISGTESTQSVFGQTSSFSNPGSSLMNNAPKQINTSSSVFGASSSEKSSPFGFSSTTSAGQSPFAASSSQSVFQNTASSSSQPAQSPFGTSTGESSSIFGGSSGSSMFASQPSTPSVFGASASSNQPAQSPFGGGGSQPSQSPFGGSSGQGSSMFNTSESSSIFGGSQQSTFGAPSSSPFGGATSSVFGQPAQPSQSPFGGGAPSSSPFSQSGSSSSPFGQGTAPASSALFAPRK